MGGSSYSLSGNVSYFINNEFHDGGYLWLI